MGNFSRWLELGYVMAGHGSPAVHCNCNGEEFLPAVAASSVGVANQPAELRRGHQMVHRLEEHVARGTEE